MLSVVYTRLKTVTQYHQQQQRSYCSIHLPEIYHQDEIKDDTPTTIAGLIAAGYHMIDSFDSASVSQGEATERCQFRIQMWVLTQPQRVEQFAVHGMEQ